ncbi:hypothetical protein DASC09_027390 [Saccharomycopsis crataegensis]|uniref:TauD/TfdA-like domain-containing protein n=1 Tax=Saccharomycopsis crataegensis TaxID=43959 RepID=A0AAV5QLU5_9ASCO|nr:hypothetical protein DASC09_027390 [Saccharomycopsis crataegensis]
MTATDYHIKHEKDGFFVSLDSVEVNNSRIVNGYVFPLVLQVSASDITNKKVITSLISEISSNGTFTDLLANHGAVLLRGFNDNSGETFSKYITAIESSRGRTPFEQIGLAGKRHKWAENVFTANEGPPNTRFYQHNEYARYFHFPSNIHFFSHKATKNGGGGSPIAHSGEFYQRIFQEIPEFIYELANRKLISVQVYPSRTTQSSTTKGNEFYWEDEDSFGQDIDFENDSLALKKQKAERQITRLTNDFLWNEDGSLTIKQHLPAFRTHPITGNTVFFNGICGRFGTSKDNNALEPPYVGKNGGLYLPSTYDDGTPIPLKYLEVVLRISREIEFLHKWEEGDILLIDNYQVSHGREPWTVGDQRIVLVSMWDDLKGFKPKEYIPTRS